MPHILLVCTANICRSPVGEAMLRDRLRKAGKSQWTVSSAGTWSLYERRAARYSIQVMGEQGLDISTHRSRMIDAQMLAEADLVLCMESGHVEALHTEFPDTADKIHLLSSMAGQAYSIQDPYGKEIDAYREMVSELTELVDVGLGRIISLVEGNQAVSEEK